MPLCKVSLWMGARWSGINDIAHRLSVDIRNISLFSVIYSVSSNANPAQRTTITFLIISSYVHNNITYYFTIGDTPETTLMIQLSLTSFFLFTKSNNLYFNKILGRLGGNLKLNTLTSDLQSSITGWNVMLKNLVDLSRRFPQ